MNTGLSYNNVPLVSSAVAGRLWFNVQERHESATTPRGYRLWLVPVTVFEATNSDWLT